MDNFSSPARIGRAFPSSYTADFHGGGDRKATSAACDRDFRRSMVYD
jgi:hypothetical protein